MRMFFVLSRKMFQLKDLAIHSFFKYHFNLNYYGHLQLHNHDYFIQKTLKLAHRGLGKTRTNPMVGAVLVLRQDTKDIIIGEGYHHGFGKPHAEVEAVKDAHKNGFSDLSRAILYINLEPCCHFGKTPPCTDLIIKEKIAHVVFGTTDPYPEVAGKSAEILRQKGIRVEYGFLDQECRDLNKAFFKTVESGLPWVSIKIAQTLDGRIADFRGDSKWISSEPSRTLVHRWRSEYDAVLVGAGTVLKDNPHLNVRLVKGRHPVRVIIDGRLRSPLSSTIFQSQDKQPTVIFTGVHADHPKFKRINKLGVNVISLPHKQFKIDLKKALRYLMSEFHIASVMVEGGSELTGQMLNLRLADELHAFIAPDILGRGLSWSSGLTKRFIHRSLQLDRLSVRQVDRDTLISGRIVYDRA